MRKILLVVLSASLLLSGCTYSVRVGNKEYTNRLESTKDSVDEEEHITKAEESNEETKDKETESIQDEVKSEEKVTEKIEPEEKTTNKKDGEGLPLIDTSSGNPITYMGDLDNKTGAVSFILDDVTSSEGFLVGTFKFKDVDGFSPIVECEGDYDFFASSQKLSGGRSIMMDKTGYLSNWAEITIYDSYWGTTASSLSDYDITITKDSEPYDEARGEVYFNENYVFDDTLETFKFDNFYVVADKSFTGTIRYTAVQFIEGYEPVIEVEISSELTEVDKDKVCEILSCIEFEHLKDYEEIDRSKLYYEDAAVDFIYKKFNFIFTAPCLIRGIDDSEIIFAEPLTNGGFKTWKVTLNTFPEEPSKDSYLGEVGGYKYYGIEGGYEMYFTGTSGDMRSLKVVAD